MTNDDERQRLVMLGKGRETLKRLYNWLLRLRKWWIGLLDRHAVDFEARFDTCDSCGRADIVFRVQVGDHSGCFPLENLADSFPLSKKKGATSRQKRDSSR